mgnify:CR=1 FL=1
MFIFIFHPPHPTHDHIVISLTRIRDVFKSTLIVILVIRTSTSLSLVVGLIIGMVGTAVSIKLDDIATTELEPLLGLELPNEATLLVFALL